MRLTDDIAPVALVVLLAVVGAIAVVKVHHSRPPKTEYTISTPGVDDHVVYRVERHTGDVCRIDFLEKATRCANAKAEVEIPYPENRIEEIPE